MIVRFFKLTKQFSFSAVAVDLEFQIHDQIKFIVDGLVT